MACVEKVIELKAAESRNQTDDLAAMLQEMGWDTCANSMPQQMTFEELVLETRSSKGSPVSKLTLLKSLSFS